MVDGDDPSAYDDLEATVDDPRLTVRPAGRHLGLTAVKNFGVEQTTGDVLAFCDDDDFWYPTKLEYQLAAVTEAGRGDGDFVSATAYHAASATTVERWPGSDPDPTQPIGDFLLTSRDGARNRVLQASTFLATRGVMATVPFRGQAFEDWDWLIRATNRFPFVFSPVAGGVFRVGEPGTMTSKTTVEEARAWYALNEVELTPAARSGFHATVVARLIGARGELSEIGPTARQIIDGDPSWRESAEFPLRVAREWWASRNLR